ncbi:MAG: MFS transporter, partial [Planctomycetota bacterium]
MIAAIAMLGIQSALFSPLQFAILPELSSAKNLDRANGLLSAVGNVAILAGTALAATADPVRFGLNGSVTLTLLLSLALAITGYLAARRLPHLAPVIANGATVGHAGQELWRSIRHLRQHGELLRPALGGAAVWMVGAIVQLILTSIAFHTYGLDAGGAALLAILFGVGLAVGSLLAPLLHYPAYPGGLPVLGALGAAGCAIWAGSSAVEGRPLAEFAIALAGIGICGGLWVVPLNLVMQQRCEPAMRGRVFAATSMLHTIGIAAGGATIPLLQSSTGLSSPAILAVCGWATLAGAAGCAWPYRRHLLAWAVRILTRLIYRQRCHALDHLPATGGCIVACNHMSYADGLLLFAMLPRPVRFLVYGPYANAPVFRHLFAAFGVIPIDGGSHRQLAASIDRAIAAAQNGEVVGIFPEGKLSRSGHLDRFMGGLERIAKRAEVPIIPAHLAGLHGTLGSRTQPRRPRPQQTVSLRLGPALPHDTPAHLTRQAVMKLSFENANHHAEHDRRSLGRATLSAARRRPWATAIIDQGGSMSRLKLCAAAIALIPHLDLADDEENVGVLLPPGRAGTIINLALALAGRCSVNLNHTLGDNGLRELIQRSGLRRVISSRLYRRKIGEPDLATTVVDAENLLPRLSKLAVIGASLRTLLVPPRLLDRTDPDRAATIIFSSGSTDTPKGAVLSHRQLMANFDGVSRHLELRAGRDVLLSPLPLFHSFGYSSGLFLGLTHGLCVAAHPDPRDGAAIGELAQASAATFMISTPTFVRGYLRRITPEQFAHLRFAVVGAEKCPQDLRDNFRQRYNADLFEGYGCTELAPVVSTNAPDTLRDGIREQGSRAGSVGRPLPGIDILTVDPDHGTPLSHGEEGLIVVRSPARMSGYLHQAELTDQVFMHGGYATGDMGYID